MGDLTIISPILLVVGATLFTWGATALGASVVFLFRKVNHHILDGMLGFAGGIMIAATIWSLIIPALELSEILKFNKLIFAVLGFVSGCLFLFIFDNALSIYLKEKESTSKFKRVLLLIFSIILHNIPEGLAIGVVFGSVFHPALGVGSVTGAIALTIGIGIQNFPEGLAVSLPLYREGFSRRKAFFYGQLSGVVEPLGGLLGYIIVLKIQYLLPLFLSFAGGAMLFVVIRELIPASQQNDKKDIITLYTLFGFLVMMILDVSLG